MISLFPFSQFTYWAKSTWGTAEGKWFYDCESDSSGNRLAPIQQNLTDNQRLVADLLIEYDPSIVPANLDRVFLEFDLINANFNAKKSFMETRGRFRAVISSDYFFVPELNLSVECKNTKKKIAKNIYKIFVELD